VNRQYITVEKWYIHICCYAFVNQQYITVEEWNIHK
jgi:hypothetical protein